MIRFASVIGCLSLAFFAASANRSLADAPNLIRELDNAFVRVYEKVAPSVVVIEADKSAQDGVAEDGPDLSSPDLGRTFHLPDALTHSEASGFIVRKEGYILTNDHAVAGAERIQVRLKDGRILSGRVVGADNKTDIAVVKIEAPNLTAVEFGDSDALRVGQMVGAIGVPFNMDFSFTVGWVSAKGRSQLTPDTMYEDYIQTNAFINPGNSGSPLFDLDGKVVGMNTLINGSVARGLSFAIPSNLCRDVETEIIATGKVVHPWLGITIIDLQKDALLQDHIKGVESGVVVQTIESDTPAYRSDLRPADVITQVDGVAVATGRDLQQQILKKKVGQSVELSVWREGKAMKIALTTAGLPSDLKRVSNTAPPAPAAPSIGLQLQDASPAGAMVTDVAPDSVAASTDIQRQDVITEIDGKPVANAAACKAMLAARDPKKAALLLIDRKGQKRYAVLGK